ncbi:MAG: hypothetical protein EZS28_025298 [Streblomastix strix]|uniref:Uncharacterized protein n=1 Tax=Streblomastix strix TaxID=222440 RepID=A0A5J4V9E0_9EUKA|nr:MAG: hypothetical protein EZS28_025298 [Streblomastix strix]
MNPATPSLMFSNPEMYDPLVKFSQASRYLLAVTAIVTATAIATTATTTTPPHFRFCIQQCLISREDFKTCTPLTDKQTSLQSLNVKGFCDVNLLCHFEYMILITLVSHTKSYIPFYDVLCTVLM